MSFTRFHDDPARIQKQNMETTAINDYTFNVPGNLLGSIPHYYQDPHIRLQKTGCEQRTNMIGIESMLRNINVPLNRDNKNINDYRKNTITKTNVVKSQTNTRTITSESRTTHPVFEYREKQQYRPDHLFYDPQKNVFIPFPSYLDTNILEKDYYNLKNYKKI